MAKNNSMGPRFLVLVFWEAAGVEDVSELAREPKQAAELTCEWLQHAYDGGQVALGLARIALLGLQDRWWWLQGQLRICWRDLRS